MDRIDWSESHLESGNKAADPVPFFGQDEVLAQLQAFMGRMTFPHTLLTGPPGIGKTHLAYWIAGERGETFEEHMCPVIPTDIQSTGVVLLDEVHRQSNPEPLFPLMDSVTGATLVGATTRPENLEPAFRSRFFIVIHLRPYDLDSMRRMLRHYSDADIDKDAEKILARAAAGNPRQLHRIITTAVGIGTWDPQKVLATCQINADGLDPVHLDYMKHLSRSGRAMGVSQLSLLLYTDEQNIKEHERLLLEYDLITLTTMGRKLTSKGRTYLEASGWT